MKLRIISDIHLEFFRACKKIWFPPEGGDDEILIIAGDISTKDMIFNKFRNIPEWEWYKQPDSCWMDVVAKQFKHVIFVYGNHDFWGSTLDGTIQRVREFCNAWDNVHFLEKDAVTIEGVKFVGGTLWTDLNNGDPLTMWAWKEDMKNDAKKIRVKSRNYSKISAVELVAYHQETKRYIFEQVAEGLPTVVVTHHSPSFMSHLRKIGDRWAHYYHSELGNDICQHENILLWVHGHTHDNVDYEIGNTRIVANMLGYFNEDPEEDFDPLFTVEV